MDSLPFNHLNHLTRGHAWNPPCSFLLYSLYHSVFLSSIGYKHKSFCSVDVLPCFASAEPAISDDVGFFELELGIYGGVIASCSSIASNCAPFLAHEWLGTRRDRKAVPRSLIREMYDSMYASCPKACASHSRAQTTDFEPSVAVSSARSFL